VRQAIAETDLLEYRGCPPLSLASSDAAFDQRERDVVPRRQRRQQVKLLEDEADMIAAQSRPLGRGERRQIRVEDDDGPLARLEQPADDVKHCRLAAAARSDEADHLAGVGLERHVL